VSPRVLSGKDKTAIQFLLFHAAVLVVLAVVSWRYPLFGQSTDYGQATMEWIRKHYRSLDIFGKDPTSKTGEGIEIFGRLEPT
jgi:hypothetical protein